MLLSTLRGKPVPVCALFNKEVSSWFLLKNRRSSLVLGHSYGQPHNKRIDGYRLLVAASLHTNNGKREKQLVLLLQENGSKKQFRKVGINFLHKEMGSYCVTEVDDENERSNLAKRFLTKDGIRNEGHELLKHLLPKHYETSVGKTYVEYAKWSMLASVFGTVSGVLSMQALLFAIGLGAGAIPMAAAMNWIVKDGLGQFGGMLCASFINQRFDAEPRRWRFLAACILDASVLIEVVTPVFPQFFLPIASVANIGKNIGWISASASRAGIHRSFMREENLADLTGKAGSQTIFSSVVGTALGVIISPIVGSSTAVVFPIVLILCGAHLVCVFQSVSAVNIPTLNAQRAWLATRDVIGDIYKCSKRNDSNRIRVNSPAMVASKENIFHFGNIAGEGYIVLEPREGVIPLRGVSIRIGTPLSELNSCCLQQLILYQQSSTETDASDDDNYVILIEKENRFAVHVLYFEEASQNDVLLGLLNCFLMQDRLCNMKLSDHEIVKMQQESRKVAKANLETYICSLKRQGWDCDNLFVESRRGRIKRP
mmetsp:Transcript_13426/g.15594  ORF Transcript_13426/g.15594 Transcript_13426/m.15594 type:complete len:541 (-) Transcript_13426:169-1791(-)